MEVYLAILATIATLAIVRMLQYQITHVKNVKKFIEWHVQNETNKARHGYLR